MRHWKRVHTEFVPLSVLARLEDTIPVIDSTGHKQSYLETVTRNFTLTWRFNHLHETWSRQLTPGKPWAQIP